MVVTMYTEGLQTYKCFSLCYVYGDDRANLHANNSWPGNTGLGPNKPSTCAVTYIVMIVNHCPNQYCHENCTY